ncbi:MAG: DUF2169 family type VI secretion system accessory protein [Myxococcota bacterium]
MPHPEIDNRTPFVFEPLFASDEEGRPIVTPLLKATYDIGAAGELSLAEEQRPIEFAGVPWGAPGESSDRYEPEVAFAKLSTDVVLIGSAHARRPGTTQLEVLFQVGPVTQIARVVGDRHWTKRLVDARPSDPEPFEKVPLVWERAFGGREPDPQDPERPELEPRNPVGCGFRARRAPIEEGAPLPNIERPDDPIRSHRSRPEPVGFGFTSPHWEPRRGFAGTYDERWERERFPLLPLDFDRRFFSAAAPGLTTPGPLRGDEPVRVVNASPEGRLEFPLPGLAPPELRLALRAGGCETLRGCLDTVIVDLEDRKLMLLWRTCTTLRDGPHDVQAFEIGMENAPEASASSEADPDATDYDVVIPLRRARSA